MRIVIPGGTGHLGGLLRDGLAAAGHEVVIVGRGAVLPGDAAGVVAGRGEGARSDSGEVIARRGAVPRDDAEVVAGRGEGVRRDGGEVVAGVGAVLPGEAAGVVAGRVEGVWWDGRTLDPRVVDGADAVINLAGRSVNCRYTSENLRVMMSSRVDSARAVGEAIAKAERPPRVWLQMSTATIYAHRFDAPNDEVTGIIGGAEPDVPRYWDYSVDIAKNWEAEQERAEIQRTRKVALRTAMVMSLGQGGAFVAMRRLARLGLGGPVAGGRQYISWLHGEDFVRAVQFLLTSDLSGPVNLAAPNPLRYKDFMRELRKACGIPVGLPATRWMAELGAWAARSDTELLLKSRRVTPTRLPDAGFTFRHPTWPAAVRDLVAR